jgi:predicted O-methyltransferase YrrM
MKKEETINKIISERGYKKYLEIGVGTGYNLTKIKCESVEGVDPEPTYKGKLKVYKTTSDEFLSKGKEKWDVIFIDGMHTVEQVEKDIINSLNRLKKDGVIIIHDICPTSEEMTIVPRASKVWTGDVYKSFFTIHEMPEISTAFNTVDFGLGIIENTDHKLELGFTKDISFEDYKESYLHGNN